MTIYYVYAIGTKECLIEPYGKCYVGVTSNLIRRWKNHIKSPYTIGKFIRENSLTYDENMIIIFEGDEEACFLIEEKYRPYPNIGLNEASGGKGGHTSYTEERNQKISVKIKEARKYKTWSTHQNRESYSGEKNPNAKHWILVDKDEKIHYIVGKLDKFCQENNLLESCLRRYIGNKVPQPNFSGYGGYRVKNETSKMLRINTTGWTLIKANTLPGGVS